MTQDYLGELDRLAELYLGGKKLPGEILGEMKGLAYRSKKISTEELYILFLEIILAKTRGRGNEA